MKNTITTTIAFLASCACVVGQGVAVSKTPFTTTAKPGDTLLVNTNVAGGLNNQATRNIAISDFLSVLMSCPAWPSSFSQTNLALTVGGSGISVASVTNNGVTTFTISSTGGASQTNLTLIANSTSIDSSSVTNSGVTTYTLKVDSSQTNSWRNDIFNSTNSLNSVAFVGFGSAALTQITNFSISTNFLLQDTMRVVDRGADYYGINRYYWPRVSATLQTNGPLRIWMVGSGWANDSIYSGILTNLFAYKPMAGYGSAVSWAYSPAPGGASYGQYSGADTAVYSTGDDTIWHQAYFVLSANGQITAPSQIVTNDVNCVCYMAGPSGGTFVLEYRTNLFNPFSFLQLDGTWYTLATVNAYSATTNGAVAAWTNSTPMGTQIRARATSAGITPILEFGQWNSKIKNGIVIAQYAHAASSAWWNNLNPAIVYPIWAFMDPTCCWLTGGYDDSQIATTEFYYGVTKAGMTNADVILTEPQQTSTSTYQHNQLMAYCWSNSIPYFAGDIATYDAWGSFYNASNKFGLYVDSSHLSPSGFSYYGELQWSWMAWMRDRRPVGMTTNYAIPGGQTLYVTNGLIYQIK